MNKFEITLTNAGKGLLILPDSPHEIVSLLQQLEKRLERVQQMPSESMKHAMQPVNEALIAKQLLRHPDMDVNISVACCISEVLRIMVYKTPYNDEQMKDFFELVVITLEKLSSASSGSYNRMIKVLRILDKGKLSLMMCDLKLDGLIVRLFKQFLTVADSNSPAVVTKMKQIIIMIIEKTEPLNHELVNLLVKSVRKENKIASPVCWQLGGEVLEKCATQLKPRYPKKVAEKVYNSSLHKKVYDSLIETIPSTTDTSKLKEEASCKRKLECLDGSRNMVQPVRRFQDIKKHEKKTISANDPPMPTKSIIEAQSGELGENLVGRRIKVWWSSDKIYHQGVLKSFECRSNRHKVLFDDGKEELLDLKQEQWELAEMVSRLSTFEIKLMNAGKGLLILPLSTAELLNVLEQTEILLNRVKVLKGKEMLSESMKYAMRPIIEALVTKELFRHPDIDVNISVACCISNVITIMDDKAPYNDEQMKDFFELAVITFEKLSSESDGCTTKLFKVLRTLSHLPYSLLKSDLLLKGLIVRLFKQFLTSADSNSSGAVSKMKQIMIIIIEQSELLDIELVDLLATSVKNENQITSPVCWKLGDEVLRKWAAKLEIHPQDKMAKYECNFPRETTQSETQTIKWTKNPINKMKLESLDGSRNGVQPVRPSRHTVNIDSEAEKKTLLSEDPSTPSTSVIEVSSDDDDEELIDITGKQWELHENVSATQDSVSFDNRDESFIDLTQEELVENMAHSAGQAPPAGDIIIVQDYSMKQTISPIHTQNEAFKKTTLLMEMKVNIILVKRAARADMIERCEELVAAEERCWKAEECLKVLDCAKDKPISTIIAKRAARVDLSEGCRQLVIAKHQLAKAERCVKVLEILLKKI